MITLDNMAQRYGVAPSQLLEQNIFDFNINLLVYGKAIEKENAEAKKQSILNKMNTKISPSNTLKRPRINYNG